MQSVETNQKKLVRLPIVSQAATEAPARDTELDIDAELRRFEEQEMLRLGLGGQRQQWTDTMLDPQFKASQRGHTTILVSGLTMAQDYFVEGALSGLGYNMKQLDCPDNDALRYGKEFGNRGQCNPTYFTVGNLVKHLVDLRDKHGLSKEEIINNYLFLTAGACGPCRFGMYVTEYRKALRDAGFDGFRVMLFQQTGGLKQATGEEKGLKLNPEFFISLLQALVAGDVVNAMGYRVRPYELEAGAADKALHNAKELLYNAFRERRSIILALLRARREFQAVKVDKLLPKPKVSIIGEFWAMTTEGDGNYGLQRFLESEGAEDDIQLVTAWILYTIWESRHDTKKRAELRDIDRDARKGLGDKHVGQHLMLLAVAEQVLRGFFQFYANLVGLSHYVLPDMDLIADTAKDLYSNELRGGEGHMEVGKLILNTTKKKANMTVSVKPFGCMPSSGVSDGVQTVVTERYPDTIYCAVETSGDGATNFYSRVQMFLFKARLVAREELRKAYEDTGLTEEQVRDFLAKNPKFGSALFKPDHHVGSTAANLVYTVAPYIQQTRTERLTKKAQKAAKAAQVLYASAVQRAPQAIEFSKKLFAEVKENWPTIEKAARAQVSALAERVFTAAKQAALPKARQEAPKAAYAEAAE